MLMLIPGGLSSWRCKICVDITLFKLEKIDAVLEAGISVGRALARQDSNREFEFSSAHLIYRYPSVSLPCRQ